MGKALQWIGGGTVAVVVIVLLGFGLVRWWVPTPPPYSSFGKFEVDGKPALRLVQIFRAPGAPEFETEENWDPTDWDAKLGHNLTYVDPAERRWDVPSGQINDGASVPKILHSFVGGGHNGLFLGAAIVHDRYCQKEEARTALGVEWPDVHRMFYYAMRASDVSEGKAKVMFGAVSCFGPPHSPGQLLRALTAWNPEAGNRARQVYPNWSGWSDDDPSIDAARISAMEAGIESKKLELEETEAKVVETERLLSRASARMSRIRPANVEPEEIDERDQEQLVQLMKEVADLQAREREAREKSQSLKREVESSDTELENVVRKSEEKRRREAREIEAATSLFASIKTDAESLDLEQIEMMAKEVAGSIPHDR